MNVSGVSSVRSGGWWGKVNEIAIDAANVALVLDALPLIVLGSILGCGSETSTETPAGECEVGEMREKLYSGPAGTEGIGICRTGIEACLKMKDGIRWEPIEAEVLPQDKESCNDKDDNCNGKKDEGFNVGEDCEVGVGACVNYGDYVCGPDGQSAECDAEPLPSTEEIPCNDTDEDCDGIAFQGTDEDGDTYKLEGDLCGPVDCDDLNKDVNPDAKEIPCDKIDENCDGIAFQGTDKDGDTYKLEGELCGPVDCDDLNKDVNPDAKEIPCNKIDENCDGIAFQGTDKDGDTYKLEGDLCGPVDCDDNNPNINPNPAAKEICNNKDDNCNGETDENIPPDKKPYSGPQGTEDVGLCKAEIKICENGILVISQAEVLPEDDLCDAKDNDCDTIVDNIAVCSCDLNAIITNRFDDSAFLSAVRAALGIGPSDDITMQDAFKKISLSTNSKAIKSVSGVECFVNLTYLDLFSNQISNLSPLAGLIKLSDLNLGANQISDLSPLAGLINLFKLYLQKNYSINDITALINNSGLGGGDTVNLFANNKIPANQIDELKKKGVTVIWP